MNKKMRRSLFEKVVLKEVEPMKKHPQLLQKALFSIIEKMAKSPTLFVKNPAKDFTRNRKLTFETVMQLLISMGGNSIYKELLEAHGYELCTATASAFVQQRNKILPFAFEFLLREFTQSPRNVKKHNGFRLFAIDGSDIHIPTNLHDPTTHIQSCNSGNGYNLMHLNAMYDLCNRVYVDAIVQTGRGQNENKALINMVNCSRIKGKVIIVADRGFESYNNFAHIENRGWNYVFRVKDLKSTGILSRLSLPLDGEFDISLQQVLTRKQTKTVKDNPNTYRFVPNNSKFDFLDSDTSLFYPISFRVVRMRISDNFYETIITNLAPIDFSPRQLKELYKMRWGIETSFRELKYAIGLIHFHAKHQEHIVQEIFAKMIMYNFAEIIISHVIISQNITKHIYQVNFTLAFHICRHFLHSRDKPPSYDIDALLRKNILPVRPGRIFKRNIRYKTAISFMYRFS